jgi:hypothetical protein
MTKKKIREVDGVNYARIPVKTHKISFGEDVASLLKKYALPKLKPGDWVAVSEKVVSVCQKHVRHISTVKVSWLAKLIVKGVKKYPNDIGYSRPEKMQVAVERAGYPRILLAMILGSMGRLFGIHGIFWIVAGHRVSEIDGFNPDAMYPYTEYVMLPPEEPEKVVQELEEKLGYPVAMVDGTNVNVEIIAQSSGVPINRKISRLILLDNPQGQGQELTPFIIVREV